MSTAALALLLQRRRWMGLLHNTPQHIQTPAVPQVILTCCRCPSPDPTPALVYPAVERTTHTAEAMLTLLQAPTQQQQNPRSSGALQLLPKTSMLFLGELVDSLN